MISFSWARRSNCSASNTAANDLISSVTSCFIVGCGGGSSHHFGRLPGYQVASIKMSNSTETDSIQDNLDDLQVVKLTTRYWKTPRGIHFSRSLRTLKSRSTGEQILDTEVDKSGVERAFGCIHNLHHWRDGVYAVVKEPGYQGECKFRLIPTDQ